MTMTTERNHAQENAIAWMDSIREMVAALDSDSDESRERIQESVLSVEVRSDWHAPGQGTQNTPEEYRILLTTGGPALRIIGYLNKYSEPEDARLECQDWGTPWERYYLTAEDEQALVTFAQQFYFGC